MDNKLILNHSIKNKLHDRIIDSYISHHIIKINFRAPTDSLYYQKPHQLSYNKSLWLMHQSAQDITLQFPLQTQYSTAQEKHTQQNPLQYIIKTDSIPTIPTTTLFSLHSSIFIFFPWVLLGFLIPLFFRLFPCMCSMLLAFSLLVQLAHDDFNYFHCCLSFSYIYVPLNIFHYFFIF